MRDLTERELLEAIRTANIGGNTIRLTYDSGPYEVTTPTHVAGLLAQAIVRKFCDVNRIAHGVTATTAPHVSCPSCGRFWPTHLPGCARGVNPCDGGQSNG